MFDVVRLVCTSCSNRASKWSADQVGGGVFIPIVGGVVCNNCLFINLLCLRSKKNKGNLSPPGTGATNSSSSNSNTGNTNSNKHLQDLQREHVREKSGSLPVQPIISETRPRSLTDPERGVKELNQYADAMANAALAASHSTSPEEKKDAGVPKVRAFVGQYRQR